MIDNLNGGCFDSTHICKVCVFAEKYKSEGVRLFQIKYILTFQIPFHIPTHFLYVVSQHFRRFTLNLILGTSTLFCLT